MGYDKDFKLIIIQSFKSGNSSIGETAKKWYIPKQTLARWIKLYERFGKRGLENDKPGVRDTPIDPKVEKIIIEEWKNKRRSVYKMRIELKIKGLDISERQIRKVYRKHRLG